jgi:hypothetical protein
MYGFPLAMLKFFHIVFARYLTMHEQGNVSVKCSTLMHVVGLAEGGLAQ